MTTPNTDGGGWRFRAQREDPLADAPQGADELVNYYLGFAKHKDYKEVSSLGLASSEAAAQETRYRQAWTEAHYINDLMDAAADKENTTVNQMWRIRERLAQILANGFSARPDSEGAPEITDSIISFGQLRALVPEEQLARLLRKAHDPGGENRCVVISPSRIQTVEELVASGVEVGESAVDVLSYFRDNVETAPEEDLGYQVSIISTLIDRKRPEIDHAQAVKEGTPGFSALITMLTEMKKQGPDGNGRYFKELIPGGGFAIILCREKVLEESRESNLRDSVYVSINLRGRIGVYGCSDSLRGNALPSVTETLEPAA